ncbi:MAG TPA: hypothetical protein VJM32_06760 [Candidatus Saccharimonadales bacterium]|nr:hypothetical protein [Candidatus Saccharimonadales bacterium]
MKLITWAKAHVTIAAISTAAVLFALGTGAYAYLNWPVDPQASLNKAIVNMYKAESAAMRITMEYKTKHGFSVALRILSGVTSHSGHYQAVLTLNTGLVDANFTGELFQAEDGDIYVKIADNAALASFLHGASGYSESKITDIMDELGGKWVRISRYDVTESKELVAIWNCALAYSQGRLQPADEPRLLDLLAKHPYAKATKELPGDIILGEHSRHYVVELDYTQEKPLYEAAGKLSSFARPAAECKDVNLDQLSDEAADIPQTFTTDTTDVWIGKGNGQLTKLVSRSSTAEYDATITVEAVYKPIKLTTPTEFVLFERVRSLLVPGQNEYDYSLELEYDSDAHSH